MTDSKIERHYPVKPMDFRDFWDICSHLQRVCESITYTTYSIEGHNGTIVREENDVAYILQTLNQAKDKAAQIQADFYVGDEEYPSSRLLYRVQSDSETAEGSVWEAAELAAHERHDAAVDVGPRLQLLVAEDPRPASPPQAVPRHHRAPRRRPRQARARPPGKQRPADMGPPALEEVDPAELRVENAESITIKNIYFDVTPAELVTTWYDET